MWVDMRIEPNGYLFEPFNLYPDSLSSVRSQPYITCGRTDKQATTGIPMLIQALENV